MFAVIFEVQPKRERWDEYLETARRLKPEIEKIDGFIDNDRFRSLRREGRLLSLSTWRDEKALVRWRTLAVHHAAQERGRFEIFADYHLRVGEIVADSEAEAPLPQQRFEETEVGAAKCVTITELSSPGGGDGDGGDAPNRATAAMTWQTAALEREEFESIYAAGQRLLLQSWRDVGAAERWTPAANGYSLRHRVVRIVRDYGMFDRREAPQYYPPVEPVHDRSGSARSGT